MSHTGKKMLYKLVKVLDNSIKEVILELGIK